MKRNFPLKRTLLASLLAGFATTALSASDYSVTPMQDIPFGFGDQYPTAINSSGTISGYSFRLDSYTAVTWDGSGAATSLIPGDSGESTAADINAAGQVLVNYYGAYVWDNGALTPIPIAVSAQPIFGPVAMNDSGQVTGTGYFLSGAVYQRHAFLVSNGSTTDLGALPGMTTSWANDMNNLGDVVGYSYATASSPRATLWRSGGVIDLGVLPGESTSVAEDINDLGRVVGSSGSRLFTWENGVLSDLGTFGPGAVMSPRAINNHGDIVGRANDPVTGTSRAFLWSNGQFTDLSAVLGQGSGCDAVDINDAGQIAVGCGYARGVYRLTPAAPSADLAIAMTRTSGTIVVGTPFSYTLNVSNAGSLAANNVIVSDALPAGATLVSATSTQGNCSGTAIVTCALGSLNSGAAAAVQITVTPNVTGVLANSANVSGTEAEANTLNNTASLDTFVAAPSADMAVTMSASSTSVKRLANLTYTISVKNNGPASATGVTLTDTLPAGLRFVSATTTQGACSGTSTVTCNLGTLGNAAAATVKITVQARSRGTFTNSAQVSSDTPDSSAGNNVTSVVVSVK